MDKLKHARTNKLAIIMYMVCTYILVLEEVIDLLVSKSH